MKKIIAVILLFSLLFSITIVSTSCNFVGSSKVKNVGKYFDSMKQISGNLYYNSSGNNEVYKITYNSIGEKNVEKFEKDGVYFIYDVESTELIETNSQGIPLDDIEGTLAATATQTERTVVVETTEPTTTKKNKDDKTTIRTIYEIPIFTAPSTAKITTSKRTTKKNTTKKKTTKKRTTKKKPRTTKPKTFILDGKKYYIDEKGRMVEVK